jgi:hypothetical protein
MTYLTGRGAWKRSRQITINYKSPDPVSDLLLFGYLAPRNSPEVWNEQRHPGKDALAFGSPMWCALLVTNVSIVLDVYVRMYVITTYAWMWQGKYLWVMACTYVCSWFPQDLRIHVRLICRPYCRYVFTTIFRICFCSITVLCCHNIPRQFGISDKRTTSFGRCLGELNRPGSQKAADALPWTREMIDNRLKRYPTTWEQRVRLALQYRLRCKLGLVAVLDARHVKRHASPRASRKAAARGPNSRRKLRNKKRPGL